MKFLYLHFRKTDKGLQLPYQSALFHVPEQFSCVLRYHEPQEVHHELLDEGFLLFRLTFQENWSLHQSELG